MELEIYETSIYRVSVHQFPSKFPKTHVKPSIFCQQCTESGLFVSSFSVCEQFWGPSSSKRFQKALVL